MLSRLLSIIDFLSYQPVLTINSNKRTKTVIGFIMSSLSCLIIVILSGFFIFETFARSNISVIYGKDSFLKPTANLTDMPLVFRIISVVSGNSLPNQEAIFNISAVFSESLTVTNSSGTFFKIIRHNVYLEKCDINKHFKNYSNYFEDIPELDKSFCYTPGSVNFTLYGNYFNRNNNISQMNIYINKCINGTNNITCKPNEDIANSLENIFLTVSFIDFQIDHNNIDNPKTPYVANQVFTLSSTVYRKIVSLKQSIQYKTDYGYVFQDIQNEQMMSKGTNFETIDLRKKPIIPGNFCVYIIAISEEVDMYFRSFGKIQTLLASMGGAINTILLLSGIIVDFTSQKSYYSLLNNKLLNYERKLKSKNISEQNTTTINNIQNSNDTNIEIKK